MKRIRRVDRELSSLMHDMNKEVTELSIFFRSVLLTTDSLGHQARVLTNGISALIKMVPESSRPSITWEYSEKRAVCNLEEGPPRTPAMLAP